MRRTSLTRDRRYLLARAFAIVRADLEPVVGPCVARLKKDVLCTVPDAGIFEVLIRFERVQERLFTVNRDVAV